MELRAKRVCDSKDSIVSKILKTCSCGDCCSFVCPLEDHENEEALHNILYDKDFVLSPENEVIKIRPEEVKFFFNPMTFKPYKQMVLVYNRKLERCRVHALAPETTYFKLSYVTTGWIRQGQPLRLRITFIPDEIREYHDVLRVHCPGDCSLMIKLSARPATKVNIPTRVYLGNVPLGEVACYKLPINPVPETKFVFAILPLTDNSCVSVHPLWGFLRPGQDPIEIIVIYKPLEYITMNFGIQIYMPQVCKTPFVIEFLAYTKPGLKREMLIDDQKSIVYYEESEKAEEPESLESEVILDDDKLPNWQDPSALTYGEVLLKNLGDIPLLSLHGVNCVMYVKMKPTHSEDELRGILNLYLFETVDILNKLRLEFIRKVEMYRKENHSAKTHRRPKVGPGLDSITPDEISAIMIEREEHWRTYKDMLITTTVEELLERQKPVYIRQRTLRPYTEGIHTMSSHPLTDDWFVHYRTIAPFINAARAILIRCRLLKVLHRLRNLTPLIVSRVEMLIAKEKREVERQRRRERKERVRKLQEDKKPPTSPKRA